MKTLTAAIEYIKGLFRGTPAPDPHVDAEDEPAYAHMDKIQVVQQDEARKYPLQLGRFSAGDKGKPSNETDGWEKLDRPPAGWDSWVDVYEGPEGTGYVTWYEAKRGKDLYRKAINVGPETWREQDWTAVAEPKL